MPRSARRSALPSATVPCIAFTFIPGICALKAPKDAVTLVSAGGAAWTEKGLVLKEMP